MARSKKSNHAAYGSVWSRIAQTEARYKEAVKPSTATEPKKPGTLVDPGDDFSPFG